MTPPLARTLFDCLREGAARSSDAVAVIAGEQSLSYGALLARAWQVGLTLRARGVGRGDRVGVLLGNQIEWLEICFGASAVGATLVPFSTWSTRRELEFLLADSAIRLLFTRASFGDRQFVDDLLQLAPEIPQGGRSDRFPLVEEIVLVGAKAPPGFSSSYYEDWLVGTAADATDLPPGEAASAMDDGLVLYTSGSSANPKAVRLRHHGIIENGFNIGERMGLGPEDRVLLSAPLFWSFGSANALPATFTHRAALVLQGRFEPESTMALVERHGCTALYTLPGMTAALLAAPTFDRARLATLRTGLTIGAAQEFMACVDGLGIREICNVYGATETYGNCCVTWHHWPAERRARCQGLPLPGNKLRFVDSETGAPVAPGEPGLAEIRGYVTPGYSGASSDQNAVAFTADGFYRTGDIGRLDSDGAFVFIGRNTEMIKRAGINVSPAEVENILMLHAGVAQAGVVGVPDPERGELVVAFVVRRENDVTVEDLIAHCRSIASKYKVPDKIEFRAALPYTTTGKLQRRELTNEAKALPHQSGGARG